jgi:hypothetical protein
MVLMNASKKTRHTSSISNQNQGGGSKKAGFPYQVGRGQWTSNFIQACKPLSSTPCCTLTATNTTLFPLTNISRPIGRSYNAKYWHIPGTKQ